MSEVGYTAITSKSHLLLEAWARSWWQGLQEDKGIREFSIDGTRPSARQGACLPTPCTSVNSLLADVSRNGSALAPNATNDVITPKSILKPSTQLE